MQMASGTSDESIGEWWAWDGDDDGAPLAPLSLDLHLDYAQRRITAYGALDSVSGAALVDSMTTLLIRSPGCSTVDIGHLTFIDAGGIGAIVTLRSQLIAIDASLSVVGATARVRRIFDIVGLGALLAPE
jgi:anti-anti-sigma factor